MSNLLFPVILAGGKGERFWPLSRKDRPKQFLSLDGSSRSLLQATADRLITVASGWNNLWVITSSQIAAGVRQQLPELPSQNLLIESQGRDTAAAVAWASLEIKKRYTEDAIIGFFPSDHWIADQEAFQRTLDAATQLAASTEAIVTLGIKPTFPSTGYGYIEQGEKIGRFNDLPAYHVNRFTEKPNRETAETFLSTGRFSWNSGMFVFRAGVVLKELYTHAPEIIEPLEQRGPDIYPQLLKQSIDYALMEKTNLAYVLPVEFGWDDLGDWNALERLLKKAENPNVELATHVGLDTQGSIVYATNSEDVIVTIGLEDVVIVRDRNVTLVINKDRSQEIKQILQTLANDPRFTELL
ncbi:MULTISPECIES: mannose-1-phosphate guanylyltransferase [Cyanophyceae]|uniref:mannose-1-phosphate guanylyltransferase n=1 Tax=Cyanophyceae TaxID=3028117 RepID=UPI00232F45D6|nr:MULTISPECIES: mannose-1-phosphate guanylyltransferase [Cyanophyceae]MDB9357194.1 mannose-1-phosphate guanylyltransferase [Nodularia spumigena CS-587/03]MDB9340649.1 mannose-1-phosphate guanylyltransferase [Nodularia spumigena CS-589/07]MDB9347283.1 mannose-1-phosphate guanylyltransferase [Nodularia spumigena CS-588/01]MDB9351587.1 mannose-1-phosphate guanylyltransferase [Nodularia spumigena CS-588/05]MDB9401866.1 mannose-1-phosphate guanylyltransferase [Microcystis aeruginosa CS-567/02-A1]